MSEREHVPHCTATRITLGASVDSFAWEEALVTEKPARGAVDNAADQPAGEAAQGKMTGFEVLGCARETLYIRPLSPPPPELVALGVSSVRIPVPLLKQWVREREDLAVVLEEID